MNSVIKYSHLPRLGSFLVALALEGAPRGLAHVLRGALEVGAGAADRPPEAFGHAAHRSSQAADGAAHDARRAVHRLADAISKAAEESGWRIDPLAAVW